MNKSIRIIAIFALCLTQFSLSSNMRGSDNRELTSTVSSSNLGTAIGNLINSLNNGKNTTTSSSTDTTSPSNSSTNTSTGSSTTSSSATDTTSSSSSSSTTIDASSSDGTDASSSTNTTTSTTNTTTTTTTTTPVKYYKNDVDLSAFKDKCLVIHNILRTAVGVANLTWSDSLATSAQAWADNMAVNGFRHSGKTGENIASTTYTTKVLIRLLGLWTKEQDYFIKGCTYPKCSSTGDEVGHYTQMVWAKTTQVGCGFAPGANRNSNYLCCQYYKAGNVIGQTVYPYTAPAN